MLEKVTKMWDYPVKNEQMSITLHGKTHAIVSSGQMRWLIEAATQEISRETGTPMSECQSEQEAKKRVERRGFATLGEVLSRMTPDERTQWENQYRFGGITRVVR